MSEPVPPIDDSEWLLRWVAPDHVQRNVDGSPKVISESFKHQSFSVDRESIRTLPEFRALHATKFTAHFTALGCRAVGYVVVADPLPENRAHALVTSALTGNALRRMARDLRDRYVILFEPSSLSV